MLSLLPDDEMKSTIPGLLERQHKIGSEFLNIIRTDLQDLKGRLETSKRMLEWMDVVIRNEIPSHWRWTGCQSKDPISLIRDLTTKIQYLVTPLLPTDAVRLDLIFDPLHFVHLSRTVFAKERGVAIETLVPVFRPQCKNTEIGFLVSGVHVIGATFDSGLTIVEDVDEHVIPVGTLIWTDQKVNGIPVYTNIAKSVELFVMEGVMKTDMIKRGVFCFIP
jgi:hypothetical protein